MNGFTVHDSGFRQTDRSREGISKFMKSAFEFGGSIVLNQQSGSTKKERNFVPFFLLSEVNGHIVIKTSLSERRMSVKKLF